MLLNPDPYSWYESINPSPEFKLTETSLLHCEDEPIFTMRQQEKGWIRTDEIPSGALELQLEIMRKIIRLVNRNALISEQRPFILELEKEQRRANVFKPAVLEKPFQNGFSRRTGYAKDRKWTVHDLSGVQHRYIEGSPSCGQWIDVDGSGRIVFADGGCIWAWPEFPYRSPIKIADLTPNRFAPIEAPDWAIQW